VSVFVSKKRKEKKSKHISLKDNKWWSQKSYPREIKLNVLLYFDSLNSLNINVYDFIFGEKKFFCNKDLLIYFYKPML